MVPNFGPIYDFWSSQSDYPDLIPANLSNCGFAKETNDYLWSCPAYVHILANIFNEFARSHWFTAQSHKNSDASLQDISN